MGRKGIWGATCPSKLVSIGRLALNLSTITGHFILLVLLLFLICLLLLLMLLIKILTLWVRRGFSFLKTVPSFIFLSILCSLWGRKWWQIYLAVSRSLGQMEVLHNVPRRQNTDPRSYQIPPLCSLFKIAFSFLSLKYFKIFFLAYGPLPDLDFSSLILLRMITTGLHHCIALYCASKVSCFSQIGGLW